MPAVRAAISKVKPQGAQAHIAASSGGGYLYYAGTLHLRKTIRLSSPPLDEGLVRLPDEPLMFAGVAHLAINGHALGVRAWAPYTFTAGCRGPGR